MTALRNEAWPDFQTVDETAVILRVSKMTVYRLLHNGEIESTRVGRSFRVHSSSLRRFISDNPGYEAEDVPERLREESTADVVARLDRGIARR